MLYQDKIIGPRVPILMLFNVMMHAPFELYGYRGYDQFHLGSGFFKSPSLNETYI